MLNGLVMYSESFSVCCLNFVENWLELSKHLASDENKLMFGTDSIMFFFKNGLKFVRVEYTYDRNLLCGFQSKGKGPKQSITAYTQTVVHLGIS